MRTAVLLDFENKVVMARNDGRSIPDDELESPRRAAGVRAAEPESRTRAGRDADEFDEEDDFSPRLRELEEEQESPFLRQPRRVAVRRSALPRKTANRIRTATLVLVCLGVLGLIGYRITTYGTHSWRFLLDSSDNLEITGLHNVTRVQVMDVFSGDVGRNIFFVALAERKKQLEQIAWVESATVSRLLPNRIAVTIRERTPVAFAQVGARVLLIDAGGVLMELPPGLRYSFPVLVGMSDNEPLSTRAARMRIYTRLMKELDSEGTRFSQEISEVDLGDPDDARVTYSDNNGSVLVHLGDSDFLNRYKIFKGHLVEWRQKVDPLRSVDLRYERQVIVDGGTPKATGAAATATAPTTPKKKPGAAVKGNSTGARVGQSGATPHQ